MSKTKPDRGIFKNEDPDPYTRTVTHPDDEKTLIPEGELDTGQKEAGEYSSDSHISEIVNEARMGLKDKTK